jgi:hypothetical protein
VILQLYLGSKIYSKGRITMIKERTAEFKTTCFQMSKPKQEGSVYRGPEQHANLDAKGFIDAYGKIARSIRYRNGIRVLEFHLLIQFWIGLYIVVHYIPSSR